MVINLKNYKFIIYEPMELAKEKTRIKDACLHNFLRVKFDHGENMCILGIFI